jgi:deoxyribodipyrimidine photo-lyase
MHDFPPTLQAAQERLNLVEPKHYAYSRNDILGAVSYLSPYLTHGFLSVLDVASVMYHRHRLGVQHKFMMELGWREYYQHVHQHLGEAGMATALHEGVLPESAYADVLPDDVRYACTGVPVIDQAVSLLYATGYVHNHARLWLASYLVHLRKVHWRVGADWLYGHLLDGDLASNYLSWQWVAGTGSSKPYLFNADNVEQFAPAPWHSRGTLLDTSYETIEILAHSQATVSQTSLRGELSLDEPPVLQAPPDNLGFTAARAEVVAGKTVWWVHPWALADLPSDLPSEVVVVAAMCAEQTQAHPWDERRWAFVAQRMAALTPHLWWGPLSALQAVFAHAQAVHVVDHLRLPDLSQVNLLKRPAPKLFRDVDKHCDSFSKWWVQVNKGVRHLQQLVYPIAPRS